ncbi:MAG: hypothetical protein WB760_32825 [Xanthobacteraceae bacterium]
MIERIPQRGMDDCAICVAAMVMGSPYSYERVLQDSNKYSKIDAEGKFIPWWETYLIDEGFSLQRWRWSETDLGSIALAITMLLEDTAGILTMSVPHLKRGHIVAVDRMGIVDPADDAPAHESVERYIAARKSQGAIFDDECFVTVSRFRESNLSRGGWRRAIANAIHRIELNRSAVG